MKFPKLLLMLLAMNGASGSFITVDSSGRSRDAYTTIQSAVDAAQPGDVVEVRGGVYHERVHISRGGEPGRPIVVQAAPNELVLVNAGRKLVLDLRPVEGLPEVYSASVEDGQMDERTGLWETPTRLRMAHVHSPGQTAQRLGSWYYDAKSRRIFLRSSGRGPASQMDYWVESSDAPAIKVTGSYVHIRNIQAAFGQHGFLLEGKNCSHVTIEGCRAFANSWAGIQLTGDNHVIRDNETFQNNTYGIQLRFGVSNNKILRNVCLWNGPNNGEPTGSSVPTDLGIYSQGGFNLVAENIVEGWHEDVYRYKSGHGANETNVLRNNVIKGHQTPGIMGVYDNTLLVSGLGMRAGMYRNGGEPSPLRDWTIVDPTGFQRATNLIVPLVQKEDPRFADVAYRDYRLQADSSYLGMGAFPERGTVFYVNPATGSDENDGLSESRPLASMSTALSRMPAGGTLYLRPGNYTEAVEIRSGGLAARNPLRLRALGRQPGVRMIGGLTIKDGQFIEVDGLEFVSSLQVDGARGVVVKHCVFDGQGAGVTGTRSPELRVDRCTFVNNDTALELTAAPQAGVTQCLFKNCRVVYQLDSADIFLGFNAYSSFHGRIGGEGIGSLEAWQTRLSGDGQSQQTDFSLLQDFLLPADSPLAGRGADFGPLGARIESVVSQLEITNPRIAGISPRGASLLWNTPRMATLAEITLKNETGKILRTWEPSFFVQIMGSSFDITQFSQAFYSSQRHAVIADLQPDTGYTVSVVARDLLGQHGQPVEITFKTPREYRQPVAWYVSPEGNDAADGRSPSTAWRSLAHACAQAGPGDEIILQPGRYRETLRPNVSGTSERKISIRAEKPQSAILDLAENIPVGVEILNTDHLVISGLLFQNGAFPRTACFSINNARDITIRDCALDWPRASNFEKLKLGYSGLVANRVSGLTVENNLFLCASWGVGVANSSDVSIRHNTFVGEGNYGVVIVPGSPEETYTIKDNVFYRATMGYKSNPCLWVFAPMPRLASDHNLFYIPEESKGTIGTLPGRERLSPLVAWVEATGLDKKSVQARPEFTNPETLDFSLQPGSPGQRAASDGRDMGRVFP